MCGIAGFINKSNLNQDKYINNIIESIKHRGPDEFGVFNENGICLLNTRLSIIDVAHGHQPFVSDDKNIYVVQNGEIYNYIEVQNQLKNLGVIFNTNSDTEVILKAYEKFGIKCFEKFNGMFAIAIFDKIKNKLILARDRLGVKPLYIYQKDNELHFSSEIKSLLTYENFDKEIDNQSIHNYLKFNYIPIPDTIYKFVKHIEPAHYYEIDCDTLQIEKTKYWEIKNLPEIKNISEEEVFEKIDEILTDAIKIRLRSDVGIGAFLSGGLDSSLVCAMTKEKFGVSLDTYSIGFKEKRFDESEWAKKVASLCDLKNKVHIVESDIIDLWNTTTWHNDQPHGDISFIPTYIISKFASKDYKLVFTGDGGDEAFAGYTKYFSIFNNSLDDYFDSISLIKVDKDFDSLYTDSFRKDVDYRVPKIIFNDVISEVSLKDDVNKILHFDTRQLLPGNNLVKPDKMAMANSLETRSPMLDYRLFEYMQSLQGKFKLRDNETKYILKKFALKYLPKDIVYRDKQMFTVPVGEWFKTHLKEYISNIIKSDSLKNRNIFNIKYLEFILAEHLIGKKDFTRELRAIVNLEIWFREFDR
ncbi:asparagine synthase (glutamine-hydrolyzing) [Aliarcobacter cryaerophilus]|uniref:asparagine synthase (glutamine-hydrolyzing) n=1 Tax=Aliarcobacter cryaerophilus TaxID=28198 RepID=UPI0016545B13|nr:asparagine synthase (glutamine-hydrolyzing) [Aliarcobacter cryaerophilus]QNM87372.1 asparagine synthase (glutamine-hydrolyzing) [Aliarcobacter cryaerophilus]